MNRPNSALFAAAALFGASQPYALPTPERRTLSRANLTDDERARERERAVAREGRRNKGREQRRARKQNRR